MTGVVDRNAVKLGEEDDNCDLRLDSSVNTYNKSMCMCATAINKSRTKSHMPNSNSSGTMYPIFTVQSISQILDNIKSHSTLASNAHKYLHDATRNHRHTHTHSFISMKNKQY